MKILRLLKKTEIFENMKKRDDIKKKLQAERKEKKDEKTKTELWKKT